MEIVIPAQPNSCITENLPPIQLGKYTVFAGENNAGKSSIIDAIKKNDLLQEYEVIEIPAEKNDPNDSETSNSTKNTPFYKILEKILDPIFSTDLVNDLVKKFNDSDLKKDFIDNVNDNLVRLGVNKKKFDVKISKEDFKDSIIIKISKAIVKDLYNTDIEDVDLNNVGMGTKRLIITALIQYYERNKLSPDKKTLIIFEEPEIYLHPSWKKCLHESLLRLSKNENVMILITTHDPYFIQLAGDQYIYRVYRDPNKKDSTNVDRITKKVLTYESDSEKNYLIFDVPTGSYMLELWQQVRDKFEINHDGKKVSEDFEKYLFSKIEDKDQYDCDGTDRKYKLTYITRLRHDIAHPKEAIERKNKVDLSSHLMNAIKDLIKLC